MQDGYQLYKKLRLQGNNHEVASAYENMYVAKEWLEQFECEKSAGVFRDYDDDYGRPGVPSEWH